VNVIDVVIPDITPPVITLNGDNPEVVTVYSEYTDPGATALDAVDGALTVTTTGKVDTSSIGTFSIIYTATDSSGNTSTATRTVKVFYYKYIPKNKFGTDNGDGHDWQVWAFNGSNIYDWSDTYADNYLHEQFKLQTWDYSCTSCLQRGIFNHNPQEGFNPEDVIESDLENSPQINNNGVQTVYDVALQWDRAGYVYTISHGGSIDTTGHTNIANVNENMWVGWDNSLFYNNFTVFPSGSYRDTSSYNFFPPGFTGGGSLMVLQPYPVYVYSGPVLSKEKAITAFSFDSLSPSVTGVINETAHTISLTVPFGTDVTNLIPTITISDKALISPNSGSAQNFTSPVTYTVTAENGSTQTYTATVVIAPDPNPPADITPPSVPSYTFNGASSDITINPTVSSPLFLVINSSENVNWMSIKIEKESDHTLYKTFQSGAGCVNGTAVCTKSWNGLLSSGGLLQSGTYKVKIHIKDPANNEYYDYLSPYVINIDTSI
jgi:hypothetical protein